ncbi:hypothetical protein ACQ856_17840 [Mycolicibacterium psychrotolerans]|uniref:hypothetical protein n=1 Tax=Mycolicibacterium psychrotolerans TaxID=216929 RepID=UPI003D67635E
MNRFALVTSIGAALIAGTLSMAGPASAAAGHAAAGHAAADSGRVGFELPFAPVGAADSGRVGLELPIAPVGTAGPGRVPMTPVTTAASGA